MHAGQLRELLEAINRNTDAQIEMARAILVQGEQIARLADEAVNLVALLAEQEQAEQDPDALPAVDMAGRPIAG